MAIQLRRGAYADFQMDRMLPGEIAVVLSGDPGTDSGKAVYICYDAGVARRLAGYDEMITALHGLAPEIKQTIIAEIQAELLSGGTFKQGAFADVANDLTTTAEGKVLDARQGKELSDLIGVEIKSIQEVQASSSGTVANNTTASLTLQNVAVAPSGYTRAIIPYRYSYCVIDTISSNSTITDVPVTVRNISGGSHTLTIRCLSIIYRNR